jgi:hypothetical protein
MKKFILSVDTEPDKYSNLSFKNIEQALPKFFDLLDDLSINATLFLVPIAAEKCESIIKSSSKCDIGLHLHPELEHEFRSSKKIFVSELPKQRQHELIKRSIKNLEKDYKIKDRIFRASSHRINLDTLHVLEELNFKVDSSVLAGTTCMNPPNMPYNPSNNAIHVPGSMKILELPITVSKYPFPLNLGFKLKKLISKSSGVEFTGYRLSLDKYMNGLKLMKHAYNKVDQDIVNFYFHSYEIDNSFLERLENFLNFVLNDSEIISVAEAWRLI